MKMSVSKRFQELYDRGEKFFKRTHDYSELDDYPSRISNQEYSEFTAWKLSAKNLLRQVFGESAAQDHYTLFSNIFRNHNMSDKRQCSKEHMSQALGILKSAKEEYELGLVHEIKHILAVEFFDSLLEQAKELLNKGYKDPAAILGRVIIENTLRDLCTKNGVQYLEEDGASKLNEMLKDGAIFTLPQFKLCRTNIELGNDAAHGKFKKYSKDDVNKMLEYIENSLLVF